ETVRYTGDNNVTYTKTCEPAEDDVRIHTVRPVYVPEVDARLQPREYEHGVRVAAAGDEAVTLEDNVHRCVHCDRAGTAHTYTYCDNCGTIACGRHTRTERLHGEPVCTGCAVVERYALKKKYFYDRESQEEFQRIYDEMPLHERLRENPYLVAALALAAAAAITTALTLM
ncbi:MAG: restriction endonuclease, partial [Halobacteriota archaeon]